MIVPVQPRGNITVELVYSAAPRQQSVAVETVMGGISLRMGGPNGSVRPKNCYQVRERIGT